MFILVTFVFIQPSPLHPAAASIAAHWSSDTDLYKLQRLCWSCGWLGIQRHSPAWCCFEISEHVCWAGRGIAFREWSEKTSSFALPIMFREYLRLQMVQSGRVVLYWHKFFAALPKPWSCYNWPAHATSTHIQKASHTLQKKLFWYSMIRCG